MKSVVVLLLVTAVSSAPNPVIISQGPVAPTTVGEAALNLINSYQKIMPCGAPQLGIPPLAPYRQDVIKLNISEEMLSLTGEITNLVVTGLDNFIVIDLSTNGNRTTFDIIFENIDILGEFDTKLYENLAGFNYNVKPKGLLNIHFEGVRINGGVTIGKNLLGGMLFKDLEHYIYIGDVISEVLESQWSTTVNRFFNKYFRDTTLLVVDENREAISKAISGYFTPLLNAEFLLTTQNKFINQLVQDNSVYESVQCN